MAQYQDEIAASSDDAEGSDGFPDVYNDTSTKYYIASNITPSSNTQGWRFLNVDIPKDAEITSAALRFATWASCGQGGVGCKVICYGNDVDDATTWSASNNPKDAIKTTASATYNTAINDVADNTFFYREIDVKTIIEEITTRALWASGNDMAFMTMDNGTTANFRGFNRLDARTYDYGNLYPRLTISYVDVGGIQTLKIMGVGI